MGCARMMSIFIRDTSTPQGSSLQPYVDTAIIGCIIKCTHTYQIFTLLDRIETIAG